MKQGKYIVRSNTPIARGIYRMVLEGDTSAVTTPGQFVNIKLDGLFLRRPISICDWDEKSITLLYKVVGHGTSQMAELPTGAALDLLTGLGNGFTVPLLPSCLEGRPLLVGGGIGLAPLYGLARRLGHSTVVAGAATKDELFYLDEFRQLGCDVVVATDDGSYGTKGFVTDAIQALDLPPHAIHSLYACGPMPMMKALCKLLPDIDGQLSLEERMGCGFGACMGCSVNTANGPKRVCKDGPVFRKEEIQWG